ncbi:hypothetical protein ACO2Q7_13620 [Rathayibacter sp. KR2-224]|uniref:hypothetical protein n=1 Tax=Rathayibacter sp. KR2-224 TaxID=3400913 RepID=UPI003C0D6406
MGFSATAMTASLLAIAGVVVFYGVQLWWPPLQAVRWHYAAVLTAAAAALALIGVTTRSARPVRAGAKLNFDAVDLTARRAWSYGKAWWMGAWTVLALLLVVTVVLAGFAASLDGSGRSAAITIVAGTTTSATDFPGWFYGIPVLIAFALMVASTLFAMSRVTRPVARANNSAHVVAAREVTVRRVVGLSTGSIAFTLGTLWLFIARSSSLAAQVPTTGGSVDVVTPFAALQIPLNGLGLILCGVGVGLIAASGMSHTSKAESEDVTLQERQRTNAH